MGCDGITTEDLFGSHEPFPLWSWYTYAHRARRSKFVARKRAVAAWKLRTWESNFAAYVDSGHTRTCSDCGAPTSGVRDPVFDLCRSCEQQYRWDR